MEIARALNINGWMTRDELLYLAKLAEASDLILEVGSYHGRSTRALADNTKGTVYCIDTWQERFFNDDDSICWVDAHSEDRFKLNLQDHIKNQTVIPFKGTLADFNQDMKFDLIFLDGDHRYEFVHRDIAYALNHVKKGTILSGHDYGYSSWPGVKKAVNEYFGHPDEIIGSIWIKRF